MSFFNADEGLEIIQGYNDILNGFKKKGINLTEDEENGIRDFISSNAISINFVTKLVSHYGAESIMSVFLLQNNGKVDLLSYILRQYKGRFYHNTYPTVFFE